MATLATQDIPISTAGLTPAYAAAAGGGDNFVPDSDTFIHAKNGSGGALTVTVDTPGTVLGALQIANLGVSVPAGGERMFGPFPANTFADSSNGGLAAITYSGVTSLTIGVFRARPPVGA